MAEAPDSNRTRQLDLESSDLPMQRSPDSDPAQCASLLTSVLAFASRGRRGSMGEY